MNPTGIEWTECTWNPVVGCKHGCWYCYARQQVKRFRQRCEKCYTFEPHIHPERIFDPLRRRKPATIFVVSMGDLWGDWVPAAWIDAVLDVIHACPQHTFLALTKNPERYYEFVKPWNHILQENLWCGITITGSRDLERIETASLLMPAHQKKFISFEPLLDDAAAILDDMGLDYVGDATIWDAIIIGPLNKRGHDPVTQREWVERIMDVAQTAGVPVILKDACEKIGFTKAEIKAHQQTPWRVR